mmetsp:Transcript_67340/g.140687  ORF Transcript_67340/g.140687 Transcript_67340/m.140687 type:complete len:243 (-) Transcript_67340:444-1172(-)
MQASAGGEGVLSDFSLNMSSCVCCFCSSRLGSDSDCISGGTAEFDLDLVRNSENDIGATLLLPNPKEASLFGFAPTVQVSGSSKRSQSNKPSRNGAEGDGRLGVADVRRLRRSGDEPAGGLQAEGDSWAKSKRPLAKEAAVFDRGRGFRGGNLASCSTLLADPAAEGAVETASSSRSASSSASKSSKSKKASNGRAGCWATMWSVVALRRRGVGGSRARKSSELPWMEFAALALPRNCTRSK